MISSLYIATSIACKLDNMAKSGKKGALATHQYQLITALLKAGEFSSLTLKSKRTKHGEMRLQNCIKYDLGSGYRLITIKKGSHIFIPLIGNHDEVDHWLEKKRFLPQEWEVINCDESTVEATCNAPDSNKEYRVSSMDSEEDLYENQLLEKIDQSLLREIFCGLCHRTQQEA